MCSFHERVSSRLRPRNLVLLILFIIELEIFIWIIIPFLFIQGFHVPKDACKSDVCVACPLNSEADVLFNWVMVISIQAVSWPSQSNYMISLGKIIPKIPHLLSDITNRCIWLENTCNFICSAQVLLEHGFSLPLMTTSKQ